MDLNLWNYCALFWLAGDSNGTLEASGVYGPKLKRIKGKLVEVPDTEDMGYWAIFRVVNILGGLMEIRPPKI